MRLATTVLTGLLVAGGVVSAQTTRPAAAGAAEPLAASAEGAPAAAVGGLDMAANDAFNAGRYAVALPMLRQLAERYKDQPDRLGRIEEKIRVCESQIAAMANVTPPTDPNAAAVPMSAEARKPHARPKDGEVRALTIQELGNFEYDAERGGNIPKDVVGLAGSKVRLNGFMIPMDQADRISRFALVPSLFACCFGQPPQIQHTVVVECPEGKSVSYYPDEINVEGTLRVDEKKEDGFIISIFEMSALSVKPAAK